MKSTYLLTAATFFLTILIIVNGCSGGSGKSVPDVSVEKSESAAASAIKVTGLDIETCPLGTSEFKVGGETAPAVLNEKGEVIMILPLFYDETSQWSHPPEGPQDVEIYCNGSLLTTLPAAVTITELQPAPGTTETIIADYAQIIADFKEITAVLAPDPGIQQQLTTSLTGVLEELLNGTGSESLPAVVNGLKLNNPEVLALLDAIYASSGLDETMVAFKALMADLKIAVLTTPATSARLPQPSPATFASASSVSGTSSSFSVDLLTDSSLAEQMRLYHTLKLFSEQVISETSKTFSIGAGALSILTSKIPQAEVAGIILQIVDFTFNKLILSVLPAELRSIQLTVSRTVLVNYEYTQSDMTVKAKNIPAPITLTDLVTHIMTAMGIAGGGSKAQAWLNTYEETLQQAILFFLDILNKNLNDYANEHPEGFAFDIDLFNIPELNFSTSGYARELYTMYPRPGDSDAEIIHPLTDRLEWQADDIERGSATLYVETVPGKFGEEMMTSNKVTVQVGGDFSLLLEQHSVNIAEGTSRTLGLKLSAPPPQDQNISVSVQHTGGDSDISVTSAHTMDFNSTNWNDYQEISIAAAEDEDAFDGSATISVWSDLLIGEETIRIKDTITAIENDNDRLYFVTNTNTVSIPEGGTGTFDVRLNREPNATVTATITRTGGDPDILIQSNNILTFDETNWDINQTVTLFASEDDDNISGSAEFRITGSLPEIGNAFIIANEQDENAYANAFEVRGSYNIYDESVNGNYSATWQGIVPLTFTDNNPDKRTIRSEGLLVYHETDTFFRWSDISETLVECHQSGDGTLKAYLFGFRWSTGETPYYELKDHYFYNNVYYYLSCADGYSGSWIETFDTNNEVFSGHYFILDESNGYTEIYDLDDNFPSPRSGRIELMDKTSP